MLAHSSPTLIAACHVLHRLYMPRHPRIALTSRLRVHTTNDITGCLQRRSPTRQSSASWSLSGADDYNLSQIMYYDDVDIWSLEPLVQIALHRSALRTAEAILVSKIEHLTASILKNPFTMSNTTGVPVNHRTLVRRTVSLHQPGYMVSGVSLASPSVAAKLRLVGALCSAGRSCSRARQLCCLASSTATWWSLSGSNR